MKLIAIDNRNSQDAKTIYWSFYYDTIAPDTAKIIITYEGDNAKGEHVTREVFLTNVHKTENDILVGQCEADKILREVWDKDFDVSSNITMSIVVDVDGDQSDPIEVTEPDQKKPEFYNASSTQIVFPMWASANLYAGWGRRLVYTSSAVPDTVDAYKYSITISDLNLFPNIMTPNAVSTDEWNVIADGPTDQESNNGYVFVVRDDDDRLSVKLFFSNYARNYYEEYTVDEFYDIEVLQFEPLGVRMIDDDHLTRIEDATPNTYASWNNYAAHKTASNYSIEHFSTDIQEEIYSYIPNSDEIKFETYQLNDLGTGKHIIANNIGYTIG